MAYQEEYRYGALREKMKKWGVLQDEPSDVMINPFVSLGGFFRAEPIDVMSEIKDLRRRVHELERRGVEKREPTKADYIYEDFKEELEEKHFGKIVAIDTESEKIVSIGDTILEAYNKAKESTGKDQFDFKRVGYKYIHKVR